MHINTVPELKKNKASQSIGRSQGGLSTKIHAICDGLGRPTAFHLSGGQVHDLCGAAALLGGIQAKILLADKAYDAEKTGFSLVLRKKTAKELFLAETRAKFNVPITNLFTSRVI